MVIPPPKSEFHCRVNRARHYKYTRAPVTLASLSFSLESLLRLSLSQYLFFNSLSSSWQWLRVPEASRAADSFYSSSRSRKGLFLFFSPRSCFVGISMVVSPASDFSIARFCVNRYLFPFFWFFFFFCYFRLGSHCPDSCSSWVLRS